MGSSKKVTVGYWYHMGVHFVPCHGPIDSLNKIVVGERDAWSGSVTSNSTITINKPNLFGGEKREGGVVGSVDVCFGESTQPRNAYLVAKQGADCPAYRDLFSLVFRGLDTVPGNLITNYIWGTKPATETISQNLQQRATYGRSFTWSAMNPYFKQPWFDVTRIFKGWGIGYTWNSTKASINTLDMNPAHIVYQCLTDPEWGMGYSTSDIDEANFQEVANQLHSEGFGLSLFWDEQQTIEDFVQGVLEHVDGRLRNDNSTGLFQIKLIRDDYVVGDLIELNPSNVIELSSFQRAAWGDLVSEVVVKYIDREGFEQVVAVQDLAAAASQNSLVSTTRDFPGIRDGNMAARVAMRELKGMSSPLASVSLVCNRTASQLDLGDAFKLVWPELGLNGVVFRVSNINKGNLTDSKIRIDALEDVFNTPEGAYTATPGTTWEDPLQPPTVASDVIVREAPYWDVATAIIPEDPAAGYGYAKLLVVRPQVVQIDGFTINASTASAGTYEEVGVGEFVCQARLASAIDDKVTTVVLTNIIGLADLSSAMMSEEMMYAEIEGECIEFVSLDTVTNTMTFKRGILDTVPAAHPINAKVTFSQRNNYDEVEHSTGETIYYKALTFNGLGELSPASVTPVSLTFNRRAERPYPPANIRLDDLYRPTTVPWPLNTIKWSHRDRLQQTVDLVDNTEGNIGPEAGTTYEVKVYKQDWAGGAWVLTDTVNTSGTQITVVDPALLPMTDAIALQPDMGAVRVELRSLRGGLYSWQTNVVEAAMEQPYGLGFRLGESLGGATP